MKLTVVTVSPSMLAALIAAEDELRTSHPDLVELELFYAADPAGDDRIDAMVASTLLADGVIIDLMGAHPAWGQAVDTALPQAPGFRLPLGQAGHDLLRLGPLRAADLSMPPRSGRGPHRPHDMPAQRPAPTPTQRPEPAQAAAIRDLRAIQTGLRHTDPARARDVLLRLARNYGGHPELPEPPLPVDAPPVALIDPVTGRSWPDRAAWEAAHPTQQARPVVALIYSGQTYPVDTSRVAAELARRLAPRADVLPVALTGQGRHDIDHTRDLLAPGDARPVDLVCSTMPFRLSAGPMGGDAEAGVRLLADLDAPYLHPFVLTRRSGDQWHADQRGVSSSEILISLMLPELDGALETWPIACRAPAVLDHRHGVPVAGLEVLDDSLNHLLARIDAWLELRATLREEVRVALVCLDNPPGEDGAFSGSFLDAFASIEQILKALAADGYQVTTHSAAHLREIVLRDGYVNSPVASVLDDAVPRQGAAVTAARADRRHGLDTMVDSVWGPAPGAIMTTRDGRYIIPALDCGNVVVAVQPSRGVDEDPHKSLHDVQLPPHHQYVAFYDWLVHEFKAHVVVHVGTHGTLEFLPGKQAGLSPACTPAVLLGRIPHVYLYYCGNPSEATIAKRRPAAELVSYQPPPFVDAGLYGPIAELSADLDEYALSVDLNPAGARATRERILAQAQALHLPDHLHELEAELYRLRRSLVPSGLHVFGRAYDETQARHYVRAVMRHGSTQAPGLRECAARRLGVDLAAAEDRGDQRALRLVDTEADRLLDEYVWVDDTAGTAEDTMADTATGTACSQPTEALDPASQDAVRRARAVWESCRRTDEIPGLLRALRGRYLPAKVGGDVMRDPAILPTGTNLVQFDARRVPTPTAVARGAQIAAAVLARHRADTGEDATSVAVVLWGLETSRTQGESYAQVLSLLGVQVTHEGMVGRPAYRIIPAAELIRPRVDVVVTISGSFRDMFPNLVDDLTDLTAAIAELDEPDEVNPLRAHTRRTVATLRAGGRSDAEAWELATCRVFGPAPGEYGSRINQIVQVGAWEREEELAVHFSDRQQYIYSRDRYGARVDGLYDEHLRRVQVVSQTRSNHEHEITDLDHYFEFFGGLSRAVERAAGRAPTMLITDSTADRPRTEPVGESIVRGLRTRALNPAWIDALLAHEHRGAAEIADRVDNVLGLAATTHAVPGWVFDAVHDRYVGDPRLRDRLIANNPFAVARMLARLQECSRRGYWNATPERLAQLAKTALDLEGTLEDRTDPSTAP